jgi:hypothetical protein
MFKGTATTVAIAGAEKDSYGSTACVDLNIFCILHNCFLLLSVLNVDQDYAIIMGHVSTCEETRDRYRVDEVSSFSCGLGFLGVFKRISPKTILPLP